MHELTPFIRK